MGEITGLLCVIGFCIWSFPSATQNFVNPNALDDSVKIDFNSNSSNQEHMASGFTESLGAKLHRSKFVSQSSQLDESSITPEKIEKIKALTSGMSQSEIADNIERVKSDPIFRAKVERYIGENIPDSVQKVSEDVVVQALTSSSALGYVTASHFAADLSEDGETSIPLPLIVSICIVITVITCGLLAQKTR